jgi:hypothetical protein
MSCTKQLPGTISFSVVPSDTAGSVTRIDRHNGKLQKFIPRMVLRLTLEALGRFTCDVACVIADCLIAALSWLVCEFLAGCATYAETMYPMPLDQRNSALSQKPEGKPRAAPLRLVVVEGTVRDDGRRPHDHRLPSHAAAIVPMTLRDRTAFQDVETVRFTGVPAARRKNRPR